MRRFDQHGRALSGTAMRLALGACAGLLFACLPVLAAPPPSDYHLESDKAAPPGAALPVGNNTAGEACRAQVVAGNYAVPLVTRAEAIYCGEWRQPSGRVFEMPGGAGDAAANAQASPWRTLLDQRAICDRTEASKILDGIDAVVLRCSRRAGGWPHVAFVAAVGNALYLADGVLPALPALEATVAEMSGRAPRPAGQPSAALRLLTSQATNQPFGSGDIARYQLLMTAGGQYNAVDDFARAEATYRDALAVNQRILGLENPGSADAMLHLAVNISDQGRFAEADELFARAEPLVERSSDKLLKILYLHYRALHLANESGRDPKLAAEANKLALEAEGSYRQIVGSLLERVLKTQHASEDVTEAAENVNAAAARELGVPPGLRRTTLGPVGGSLSLVDQIVIDPMTQAALNGIAELLRFRSVLAYHAGRYDEALSLARQTIALVSAFRLNSPTVPPRAMREAGESEVGLGNLSAAERALMASTQRFQVVTPNEHPYAVSLLATADAERRAGNEDAALLHFRTASEVLKGRRGATEWQIFPYLDTLFDLARKRPANQAAYYAEMFKAAQLIESGVTAQLIAKASARLAADDPKVADLLRAMQTSELELRGLYEQRDAETAKPDALRNATTIGALDRKIREAEERRGNLEEGVQAASPKYRRLVQTSVDTAQVVQALRPDEALLQVLLGQTHSYGFLAGKNGVVVYEIGLTADAAAKAVAEIRATLVPMADSRLPPFALAPAHALYRALFGPIAQQLAGIDELVIVPSGALLSLPFALLPTEAPPPVANNDYRAVKWLIAKYALSYVPAAQNFVALRAATAGSRAPKPFIGFGDFVPPTPAQVRGTFASQQCRDDAEAFAQLGSLHFTRSEVTDVGNEFHADSADRVFGSAFTKAAVQKLDLDQYRIVLFATHGLLPTDLRCLGEAALLVSSPPSESSADDALLKASEILFLKLDADLVVLSACNTAGPAGAGGENLSGLARAFFNAGARRLLVTHWLTDETAAAIAMSTFFDTVSKGTETDLSQAMRETQLAMITGADGRRLPYDFSHPFKWAVFAIIGPGPGSGAVSAQR